MFILVEIIDTCFYMSTFLWLKNQMRQLTKTIYKNVMDQMCSFHFHPHMELVLQKIATTSTYLEETQQ
jgi:hypothetical protein